MSKVHLLVIDPQNDFTDPQGSLYVPGANADVRRLAAWIERYGERIDCVSVSLDTHRRHQIFHAQFWKNARGENPPAFTTIRASDVQNGNWEASRAEERETALRYVIELERRNRYTLTIWPYHCLQGSWGSNVDPVLFEVLQRWERSQLGTVDFVVKGTHPYTEHYSAIQAEVADPRDQTTNVNQTLLKRLDESSCVVVAGEAFDYCLYNTLIDLAKAPGYALAGKIVVLGDASSAIDPRRVEPLRRELEGRGIRFRTTEEGLSL